MNDGTAQHLQDIVLLIHKTRRRKSSVLGGSGMEPMLEPVGEAQTTRLARLWPLCLGQTPNLLMHGFDASSERAGAKPGFPCARCSLLSAKPMPALGAMRYSRPREPALRPGPVYSQAIDPSTDPSAVLFWRCIAKSATLIEALPCAWLLGSVDTLPTVGLSSPLQAALFF